MSLDHYEEGRRRIGRIPSHLDETVERLRTNTSLPPRAPREMAKATVDARKMADQVKTEVVTARQQRRNEVVRHLFGIAPGDGGILTMRDAADRANKIETPAAAGTALRQAQLAGDHSMAKAIARHAVTNSWTGIVSEYVDALPLAESTPTALALQELSAIPHGANTDLADSAVSASAHRVNCSPIGTATFPSSPTMPPPKDHLSCCPPQRGDRRPAPGLMAGRVQRQPNYTVHRPRTV